MGQYYLVVNVDKGEYLNPHRFGDGLKLLEFGSSASGTMTGLAVLLADGNNRGGGDLRTDHTIVGSWAGDRIVVAGDYADPWKFIPEHDMDELYSSCLEYQLTRDIDVDEETRKEWAEANSNLYTYARDYLVDISKDVIEALKDDPVLNEKLERKKYVSFKREIRENLQNTKHSIGMLHGSTTYKEQLIEYLNAVEEGLKELEDYEFTNSLMAEK